MTLRALIIAAVSLVLDRLTKLWIVAEFQLGDRLPVLPFFDLVRWHNEGAAFSVLATAGDWKRWFFIVLGVGFCGFILYELRRLPKSEVVMLWVYGLILGGALGNLVDRITEGYVVDFLLFHYGSAYFPAFNVADSSLFCGAVLWIIVMIREARANKAAERVDV